MKKITIILLALFANLLVSAQTKTGKLFIIGGGERSDALMQQLLTTAEMKDKDYVIVLPMASEIPDTGFNFLSSQLRKIGSPSRLIRNFNFAKHDVNDKSWNDSLANAKLIYILGGDQNRFMKVVDNTPVYAAIHQAFRNGATIAGTSAGAAVMSKFMITGKHLVEPEAKDGFNKLVDKNIEFAKGLGLLSNTIIDQHFIKRNRYGRLISALAAHPDMIAVGIDESTAIIVKGNQAQVAGESQVLRLANPKGLQKTSKGLIKFNAAAFSLYTAGDVFSVRP